ncbi:MAG: hypothetical protein LBF15_05295 [Candidatus Peribacteria bacterium]|nr:hypothetical protein [Candidatus Peribacteria bacterium]
MSLSQSSCKNNIGSLDANSYYWSGTISKNPQYALKVKLSDGSSDSDMKTKNLNVVCVKSEIPTTPTVCNNLAWKVNNHVQLPYTTEALAYK